MRMGQVRNDHPLPDVLRLLHPLDRVVRHRSLVVCVPQDRLEGAQYVDLIAPADAVGLQLVQETLHHAICCSNAEATPSWSPAWMT
jgi:hypothetical protein